MNFGLKSLNLNIYSHLNGQRFSKFQLAQLVKSLIVKYKRSEVQFLPTPKTLYALNTHIKFCVNQILFTIWFINLYFAWVVFLILIIIVKTWIVSWIDFWFFRIVYHKIHKHLIKFIKDYKYTYMKFIINFEYIQLMTNLFIIYVIIFNKLTK